MKLWFDIDMTEFQSLFTTALPHSRLHTSGINLAKAYGEVAHQKRYFSCVVVVAVRNRIYLFNEISKAIKFNFLIYFLYQKHNENTLGVIMKDLFEKIVPFSQSHKAHKIEIMRIPDCVESRNSRSCST